jgi:hypothetical protein
MKFFIGALPQTPPTFFCYHQKKSSKENSPRPERSLELYGCAYLAFGVQSLRFGLAFSGTIPDGNSPFLRLLSTAQHSSSSFPAIRSPLEFYGNPLDAGKKSK